ncbi:hypothetical protein ACFMBG_16250 [Leisingera sp. D0M16]|uniref:hypothetical protein n=1 Tax=Leisingera coralii TaxID=3351347 RepID=UPI003B78554A
MTFEYSLDSFRAPTTNVPFLIEEFLEALSAHQELGLPLNSALHILDELEKRLRSNQVVSDLISVRLDNYLKFDRSNVEEMQRAFNVLLVELDPRSYVIKCFELLKGKVVENEKKGIEFFCREAVTTLLNLGVSSFFINKSAVEHFFGSSIVDSNDCLDEFLRKIYPHYHKFDLILKIKTPVGVVKKEILGIFDLSLSSRIPKRFLSDCSPDMKTLEKGWKYLVATDLRAFDYFSAVEVTKDKIARLHDLFGMFYHKGSYALDQNAVVVQKCCLKESFDVQTLVNRMHFVDDNKPKDAASKLDHMVKTILLPSGPDREKFFRVIDFHGISSKSETVENQVINLWTSLETLVPAKSHGSIISGVAYGVLPFIGLNYVRRIFERLTFDILRWNRRELTRALADTKFPAGADIVEKVFCLVVVKENEDTLSEFLGRLLNFELLRFRVFTLNKMYSRPEKIFKSIESHQQRVEWQLHRIYRTRNSIVHSGHTPKYTSLLVSNAHDYFDQVFSTVCKFSSQPGGFDNFSSCFDYAERLYAQYHSDISRMSTLSIEDTSSVLWKPIDRPTKWSLFPS